MAIERIDDLRALWRAHGIRAKDGRGEHEMTDLELGEAMAEIVQRFASAMAPFVVQLTEGFNAMAARLSDAVEPLRRVGDALR